MTENLSPTTTANPRTNVITGRADAWIIDLDHIDSGLIRTWGPRSAGAGPLEHLGTPLSAESLSPSNFLSRMKFTTPATASEP